MTAKRERLASVLQLAGVTRALESLRGRRSLYIFNYHRIGRPGDSPYDHGLFDAEPEQFELQVAYLKSRFHIARLEEVRDWVERKMFPSHAHVLLTFDDGYVDNYQVAYPILKALGVQGTFFLPTAYVGTSEVPWWDRIAFLVRTCKHKAIVLHLPTFFRLDLEQTSRAEAIRSLLSFYKSSRLADPEPFIRALEQACGAECPRQAPNRLFMTWEEAREMARGGMAFGSHTHTHPVLSSLSPEAQFQELSHSRALIAESLNVSVDAVAYPVGGKGTFNAATLELAARAGYKLGFSYYGGANIPNRLQPLNLFRFPVERGITHARFRLRTSMVALSGKQMF